MQTRIWILEGVVAHFREPTDAELRRWHVVADSCDRISHRAGAVAVVVDGLVERRAHPTADVETVWLRSIGPVLLEQRASPERELDLLGGEAIDPAEILAAFPDDPGRPSRWDVFAAPRRYEITPELMTKLALSSSGTP